MIRYFKTSSRTAVLAAVLALAGASSAEARTPQICPQFVMTYCALVHGRHITVETNACFAKQQHIRLLHTGRCRRAPRRLASEQLPNDPIASLEE